MNRGISDVLLDVCIDIPMCAVCIVGFVLTIKYRRRFPVAGILTAIALALKSCSVVANIAIMAWLPEYLTETKGWSNAQMDLVTRIISFAMSLVDAVAVAIFLLAIFRGRANNVSITDEPL